jgi:hypothetical protein
VRESKYPQYSRDLKVTIYNLHVKGARNFYLLRNFHTAFWAHPASYSMGTGGIFSLEEKQLEP